MTVSTDQVTQVVEPGKAARASRDEEGGFVLIYFALTLTVFLAMAGLGIDLWNLWRNAQEVQRAADAGALAGVTFLPADLGAAKTNAFDLVEANGYPRGQATVELGDAPSRLKVTVRQEVNNTFMGLLGVRHSTVTRSAVAEFNGPTPLGSPVNNLGNQPIGTGDVNYSSGLVDPESANPQVWLNLAAVGNNKENGDRFAANGCTNPASPGGVYACPPGETNSEYTADGYVFMARVNVGAGDLGKSLIIESYDPAFVQTGDSCSSFSSDAATNTNIRSTLQAIDARYDSLGAANNRTFCPGDHRINGAETPALYPSANYRFYAPDNTPYTVSDNPLVTAVGCSETTYRPYGTGASETPADLPTQVSTPGSYANQVFHKWVRVCTIPLNSLGITTTGQFDVPVRIAPGPGTGHNRYSLRTGLLDGGAVDGTKTSIFAFQHLPLYQNAEAADSRFYLARVVPSGQDRVLSLQLFDVGDGTGNGTITIVPPPDSNMATFPGCRGTRAPAVQTLSFTNGCTLENVSSANYQAQRVAIDVPIPSTYSCDASIPTACWIRVRFNWSSGVTDTTTWSAGILGDPVRLIE